MTNPFDLIAGKKKKIEDSRKQLQHEINELEAKSSLLDEKARKSALEDDLEQYMKIKQDKERTDAQICMKKMQLEQVQDLPEDEVKKSWNEYRVQYEKEFAAAEKALKAAKEKYLEAFRSLVMVENEGLKEQARMGRLIGLHSGLNDTMKDGSLHVINLIDQLPMKVIDTANHVNQNTVSFRGKATHPDLAVYRACYPKTKADQVLFGLVAVDEKEI